jgi:hypothetical protein
MVRCPGESGKLLRWRKIRQVLTNPAATGVGDLDVPALISEPAAPQIKDSKDSPGEATADERARKRDIEQGKGKGCNCICGDPNAPVTQRKPIGRMPEYECRAACPMLHGFPVGAYTCQ